MKLHAKAVLFDAVGTLITPRPSVAAAYHGAGERHGAQLPIDVVATRFAAAVKEYGASELAASTQPNQTYRTSEERERNRWRAIVGHVFPELTQDVTVLDNLFDDLWAHFADPAHWALFDDVPDVWQSLREQGITVGVASNFDRRLLAIGEALAPLGDCEHWFVSSLVGHRKPGPAFYQAIEDELQLPPDQLLLIGDDLENDYLAARRAGWQALFIDRSGAAAEHEDVEPAHRLSSLGELVEVLAL